MRCRATSAAAVELVLRHCLLVSRDEARAGDRRGDVEREGGTVCVNVDRGSVRGVYVCTGLQRWRERGRGARWWLLAAVEAIPNTLSFFPPKKDGEFHDDLRQVQWPVGGIFQQKRWSKVLGKIEIRETERRAGTLVLPLLALSDSDWDCCRGKEMGST